MMPILDHVVVKVPKTKKESILMQLRSLSLLSYGALITIQQIEEMYSVKKCELPEKDWAFILLNLMSIIESQGFFTTTRNKDGKIYIFEANEMADENDKLNKKAYKSLKQRQRALHMIDPALLSEKASKKLEFEILRNGSLEIEMSKNLKHRCRY